MPRPRGGGGGNAARSVPHPGTSGANGPTFISPFQPPPSTTDFYSDTVAMDPQGWHVEHIGGSFWRTRMPTPSAIGLLNEIMDRKGGSQVQSMNMFLAVHLHPDDLVTMVLRMIDPDDGFGTDEYQQIYRMVATIGTARPFSQSSASPAPPPTTGAPCAPSWLWEESAVRWKH